VGKLRHEGVTLDITHQTARAPFYVPYAGLDDREILREIALLHRAPADTPRSTPAPSSADTRARVAFLSSFFKDHTVGLWTQGIIATLPREQFHVTVISTQRHEDNVARFIRSQADAYVELPAALPAARERIASLGLDVLIYADIGMEPMTYTLAFSRLAPVQCAMWGHPSTGGIANVDYFISSALAETAPDAQANYTEKLIALNNLPLFYYRPPPASKRTRESFGLATDAHVYGCLHSTFKLHPRFDAVLAGIVNADPAAVVLVPRTGASNWDRMVLDRIRAARGDAVARHIRFIDRLSRDDFAALNRACDVTLAPFPFGAGDTSLIALAEGVPVVTLATNYLRGNFTAAMYRAMGWAELVADSPEQYVQIATSLANDRDRRREVEQMILSKNSVLFENSAGVDELAKFLLSVCAK
jgi:predicted O-linked N-acetylglucosamine transferase (SPINDLY family)